MNSDDEVRTDAVSDAAARTQIESGRVSLGIELGSTRIKACVIGDDRRVVLATGSFEWENTYGGDLWTYEIDDVWKGLRAAFADLADDAERRYGARPAQFDGIGISGMMHGYLAFDAAGELLVPFRTWRNTNTPEAAAELSELFGVNIPLRWSIAHLHQAIRDGEVHVPEVRSITTLAGYVHWQLTGKRVLGVGDASGMFPIDPETGDYDAELIRRYDDLDGGVFAGSVRDVLPEVLLAGQPAGELTDAGAALLDPTGELRSGAVLCPPEGDAGTGMVATGAIAPRTGNVSAGTSIFAMVVLEHPLAKPHDEIDVVTTPAGDLVAMVHCNNGASELAAWVGLFRRFAEVSGVEVSSDAAYEALFREALAGEADAGGLIAYNHLAGEPIAEIDEGRPLFVRTPDSRFTLANTMRAHLYGVFATLSLGMRTLADEGVALDRMYAHGGMFRTAGVAQRFLAGALDAPVTVSETAAEGGAWGVALLAAFTASGDGRTLDAFLRDEVFEGATADTAEPDAADVAGFEDYLERYNAGLAIERTAGDVL